jgi:uncharacterized membrane protein
MLLIELPWKTICKTCQEHNVRFVVFTVAPLDIVLTDVSEDRIASIFRVEVCCTCSRLFARGFLLVFYPENGGDTFLRNCFLHAKNSFYSMILSVALYECESLQLWKQSINHKCVTEHCSWMGITQRSWVSVSNLVQGTASSAGAFCGSVSLFQENNWILLQTVTKWPSLSLSHIHYSQRVVSFQVYNLTCVWN